MSISQKHVFIFIGPPGSGKGSLSQLCVKRSGWVQLSTGDLCRKHIADKTEIGKQIDFIIQSGKLISDDLIIKMVNQSLFEIFRTCDVVILDGFPRTLQQAKSLDVLLSQKIFAQIKFHVIELTVNDTVLIERLSSRLVCPNKNCLRVYSKTAVGLMPRKYMICDYCDDIRLVERADDSLESIRQRLDIYYMHSQELIDFYKNNGFVVNNLKADLPLEDVYVCFMQMVNFLN